MRLSSANISVTVVPYSSRPPNQQPILPSPKCLRNIYNRLLAFPWHNRRSNTTLPHHNTGNLGPMTSVTNPSSPQQQRTLHLMSCVHRSRDNTVLLQDYLGDINNDRALFGLLKDRIPRRRNRLLQILSCRSIGGVHFSKVSM